MGIILLIIKMKNFLILLAIIYLSIQDCHDCCATNKNNGNIDSKYDCTRMCNGTWESSTCSGCKSSPFTCGTRFLKAKVETGAADCHDCCATNKNNGNIDSKYDC